MLSYIWDSMLVVLVGGIGWSAVSFLLITILAGIAALLLVVFEHFSE